MKSWIVVYVDAAMNLDAMTVNASDTVRAIGSCGVGLNCIVSVSCSNTNATVG